MKGSVRYIITRPCLSEGSVRLLKYLESTFPGDGAVALLDDQGAEHAARVDRRAGRVYGLRDLYQRHNLGVNDVLLITPLAEGRYQVECVVKPHVERPAPAPRPRTPDTPQRVVVSESPYVREVRLERRPPARTGEVPAASARGPEPRPDEAPVKAAGDVAREAKPEKAAAPALTPPSLTPALTPPVAKTTRPATAGRERDAGQGVDLSDEGMLRELCSRVGYRPERLADGVMRLRAELGPQGYSVMVALNLAATGRPEWREEADYLAVLVGEHERPQGLPRLTREALAVLIENARLAPLTPIELRGYWNAGSFDLESAASVAELVSAQLSQRGVFSFVLLSLAQQPAHSVVSSARLAERLGSGVNAAELNAVLQTLANAPFSALSPLGNGQYYLRTDVHDVLRGLGEYAEGLRVRLGAETRAGLMVR